MIHTFCSQVRNIYDQNATSWVHSGDQVIFTREGDMFVVDRLKVYNVSKFTL